MTLFALLCYLAALLCFLASAFGDRSGEATALTRGRLRFLALGLAFWVLVNVVHTVRVLN